MAGDIVLGGGGFASVCAYARGWALAETRGVRIRCRGDGRTFKLTVRMDAQPDGVEWQHDFVPPPDGQWHDVNLEWSRCTPSWRGCIAPDAEPLAAARICSFGRMLSRFDDHGVLLPSVLSGQFQLDVHSVTVLRPIAYGLAALQYI
ncbi:NADH:ubiquinone oxidoreductase intermediate-associated protein 30 [Pavlovales sp. CCMP2436]|nr:NADH:ubiquinone oxidoreductase intermediate-associated protein 30 [Pavlovales sp. CCMP2436]|mmetsp:Transcript_34091/g.85009  ORF Transcript_34091/g.85009 Transcript_34091/m.85009 type:complete len:147 (+) Transcript_34091:211-651(+)